ncbi:cupredoxin domain-containing protein [Piscinibacter terrae]|uniref:Blue (type 1) copper domain-containing protein n=1 Tax=Piscinibacter terrae TaxID=2496871 RepID=A0A3N7HL97_9BURK|nr:cupredoxin family protein [Albitalea terrae]RQP21796.1 hypothetical protein DZC73_25470 [Albitalea terrae]
MKKSLIALAAALFAVGTYAHDGEDHAASAAAGKAADGHSHGAAGHSHGDASAIGAPGDKAKVTRTVSVDMTDAMRFNPSSISAKQNETIRFVIKNSGAVKHEFVLGTEAELKEHYELMKKFPEMEHSDPNQVTVAPGKTGEVIWKFTKAGKIDFACLQPGHYDAGMKGAVNVAAGKGGAAKGDGHADHKH